MTFSCIVSQTLVRPLDKAVLLLKSTTIFFSGISIITVLISQDWFCKVCGKMLCKWWDCWPLGTDMQKTLCLSQLFVVIFVVQLSKSSTAVYSIFDSIYLNACLPIIHILHLIDEWACVIWDYLLCLVLVAISLRRLSLCQFINPGREVLVHALMQAGKWRHRVRCHSGPWHQRGSGTLDVHSELIH